MWIALCLAAFCCGIALGNYYTEMKIEEQHERKLSELIRKTHEMQRKAEFLDYVWRCRNE